MHLVILEPKAVLKSLMSTPETVGCKWAKGVLGQYDLKSHRVALTSALTCHWLQISVF